MLFRIRAGLGQEIGQQAEAFPAIIIVGVDDGEGLLPRIAAAEDRVAGMIELVLSLKGKPVQELYDAIGMPTGEAEYASSCLVTGGKDGVLPYDGFTVYTLVQPDGTETVYDVEKN